MKTKYLVTFSSIVEEKNLQSALDEAAMKLRRIANSYVNGMGVCGLAGDGSTIDVAHVTKV